MLPIEDDEWIASLGARGQRRAAARRGGASASTRRTWSDPVVYERIKDAELLSELKTFRKSTATRRKMWEAKKWPEHLLPIGDALSSVNPTYGQGMTVAACEADALAGMLDKRSGRRWAGRPGGGIPARGGGDLGAGVEPVDQLRLCLSGDGRASGRPTSR